MNPTARREGIRTQMVGDELVVYDEGEHLAHCLTPTAALIWQHCDGATSIHQLATYVEGNEDLVRGVIGELEKVDLLTEPVTATARRSSQQLEHAARLAATVPVIRSLVVPEPAAAVSFPGF